MKINLFLSTGYCETQSNGTAILQHPGDWANGVDALVHLAKTLFAPIANRGRQDLDPCCRGAIGTFCSSCGTFLKGSKPLGEQFEELVRRLTTGDATSLNCDSCEAMYANDWRFVRTPARDRYWVTVRRADEVLTCLIRNQLQDPEEYPASWDVIDANPDLVMTFPPPRHQKIGAYK